jgi:hypothetical protein
VRVLYCLLVGFLLWVAIAVLRPASAGAAAIYAGSMVLLIDFWRRVFRKP